MSDSRLLTPRDLAEAIGTSESSVRRWLDAGSVKVTRTAGGHRRIDITEALRFIRDSGATVVRPEILNLTGVRRRIAAPRQDAGAAALFEALVAGSAEVARGRLASWYLEGRPVAEIIDAPVRLAMERVGELWLHSTSGILEEHRASAACFDALTHLRQLLVKPAASAPLAVGGAPEGDYYLIPSLAASIVLRDAGLRTQNYGANTPVDALARAALEHEAQLIWLSFSVVPEDSVMRQFNRAARMLKGSHVQCVIGGRFVPQNSSTIRHVRRMASMTELAAFAATLR